MRLLLVLGLAWQALSLAPDAGSADDAVLGLAVVTDVTLLDLPRGASAECAESCDAPASVREVHALP